MSLDPAILEKLRHYEALLLKWQRAINLVSPTTIDHVWQRHFEDSLAILPFLQAHHRCIVDLGSGAGFAGMVIAICNPERLVHLIESDQKKCSFLKTVSRETGASNATIHNARVEDVLPGLAPDVITGRAFAPLKDILDYISPLLPNTELEALLHKGRQAQEEISVAAELYDFKVQLHQNQVTPDSHIMHLSAIARG